MMRLWVRMYARTPSQVAHVAMLSAAAHAALIAACVYATRPAPSVAPESFANRAYYIPPPDKIPGERSRQEVVHYVELPREGPGTGDGPRTFGALRPVTPDESVGRATPDTVVAPPATAPPPPPPGQQDSVFTVLDVDTAVVRSANSAAPAYPLKLLAAHIVGSVSAQYVVDTTGFADTASFTVMKATHPEFVAAVRQALPYMRFTPAKIGAMKVRQLVEQQFSFKIADTGTVAPRKRP